MKKIQFSIICVGKNEVFKYFCPVGVLEILMKVKGYQYIKSAINNLNVLFYVDNS